MFKTKRKLAGYAIEYFLKYRQFPQIYADQITEELTKKIPVFVTVYVDNQLRGCVGNYLASSPLYINIIRNSINAAFFDSRFLPLQPEELAKLEVTVSCLTELKKIPPKNITGLLQYLQKNKPGLLISSIDRKALFLPQVWEKMPNVESFLSELCLKAGLPADFWKKEGSLTYWTFNTF